jgi:hypothetical protein
MTDFCGYIFYKNRQGAFFIGYKLKDGQIIEILTPNNDPRPESLDEDNILDTFTVTATRPANSGPIFSNLNFNSNNSSGININSFLNSSSVVSGGSSNSSLDGQTNPVLDSTRRICPRSFEPHVVSMQNGGGGRTITDNTLLTAGLRDLTIDFGYNDRVGRTLTSRITIEYLFISMPNNCGLQDFGTLASQAISTAVKATQASLSGKSAVGSTVTNSTFQIQLSRALTALDSRYCAGHNSPTRSSVVFLNYAAALRDNINKDTSFTEYYTCP